MEEYNVSCTVGGTWDTPKDWPVCLPCKLLFLFNYVKVQQIILSLISLPYLTTAVNCTEPPEKPGAGTWEWNGELVYDTDILYTCGPYGNFLSPDGLLYEELVAVCAWNKTWVPSVLDTCAATSCQEIPFPPKEIGLVYTPDEKNNITLASGEPSHLQPLLRIFCVQPGPSDDPEVCGPRVLWRQQGPDDDGGEDPR